MAGQDPKYQLVIDWIKENIESGALKYGDRIKSEKELSEQFGLSRQTVRRATSELEKDKILTRVQIDGFFGSLPFPPQAENSQSTCFSSFMIRPRGQSLPRVVSRFHNAGAAGCGCPPDDGRRLRCQCYSIIVSVYF